MYTFLQNKNTPVLVLTPEPESLVFFIGEQEVLKITPSNIHVRGMELDTDDDMAGVYTAIKQWATQTVLGR
jgi:hypothetical protein